MSSSFSPGIIGATFTPTEMPAAASVSITRSRRAGVGTYGSMARACSASQNGMLTVDVRRGHLRQRLSTSMSRSISGDLVMMPTGFAVLDADLQAAARQPVRGLQRLIAVGDAAEDHRLALPALLGEGLPQQRGARAA